MTTFEKLSEIASNLWWSWHPEATALFRELDPGGFADHRSPVLALQRTDSNLLEDSSFMARVDATHAALEGHKVTTPAFQDAPHVAYFCMEYGLHESLPLYSGGLGILAGDHTKAASCLGIPFTAVGFFLKKGYFTQSIDASGYQHDSYTDLNPDNHPLELVTDDTGAPVTADVRLGNVSVSIQAYEVKVGRSTLYLLDSDREENPEEVRALTTRLYYGDLRTRIQQELILGIAGLRFLRQLEVEPDLYHMNEGHSAFLSLELLRENLHHGMDLEHAKEATRDACVFTTHTPVSAGHDRFQPDLFKTQIKGFADSSGLSASDLLTYGQLHRGERGDEPFVMTVLGLNLSRSANGVSKINAEVAREQWTELYPDRETDFIPINSITNGVHLPTWTAPSAKTFLNTHLGYWMDHVRDAPFWAGVHDIPDEDLWSYRKGLRSELLDFATQRAEEDSLPQEPDLHPDALTIGFARRFATYKRATLFFSDVERAASFFQDPERPLQMIFAGKAHPDDEGGKALIQKLIELSKSEPFKGRLIFLQNYDMEIGRKLISGCDVWLNNPRQPFEASGTSGQKIAVHGGLNCSILDGWWPEGYTGDNGWAFGDPPLASLEHSEEQDWADAEALYEVLADEVVPTFWDRNDAGVPERWVAYMKRAMAELPAKFSAERMVADYVKQVYMPEG